MRLRATVTPTVGALCPFGKARFTPPAIDNASAFGKFADVRYWDGPAVHSGLNCWTEAGRREARLKEHAMRTSQKAAGIIATIGIDIGKNDCDIVLCPLEFRLRGPSGRLAETPEGPGLTRLRHWPDQ